ncbi:unnamed protein product [Caretta caretta]
MDSKKTLLQPYSQRSISGTAREDPFCHFWSMAPAYVSRYTNNKGKQHESSWHVKIKAHKIDHLDVIHIQDVNMSKITLGALTILNKNLKITYQFIVRVWRLKRPSAILTVVYDVIVFGGQKNTKQNHYILKPGLMSPA